MESVAQRARCFHTCGVASLDNLCPAISRDVNILLVHTTYSCWGQWVKNISLKQGRRGNIRWEVISFLVGHGVGKAR